jgi:GTP-binding protein HflX
VVLPFTEGALVGRVHAEGEVLAERHVAEGTVLQARVKPELAAAVERASVGADVPVP